MRLPSAKDHILQDLSAEALASLVNCLNLEKMKAIIKKTLSHRVKILAQISVFHDIARCISSDKSHKYLWNSLRASNYKLKWFYSFSFITFSSCKYNCKNRFQV